jgi:hypothetical protein
MRSERRPRAVDDHERDVVELGQDVNVDGARPSSASKEVNGKTMRAIAGTLAPTRGEAQLGGSAHGPWVTPPCRGRREAAEHSSRDGLGSMAVTDSTSPSRCGFGGCRTTSRAR